MKHHHLVPEIHYNPAFDGTTDNATPFLLQHNEHGSKVTSIDMSEAVPSCVSGTTVTRKKTSHANMRLNQTSDTFEDNGTAGGCLLKQADFGRYEPHPGSAGTVSL